MPGRIQVVPTGLLSLLGLKTTGQNPTVFPDTVAPTVAVRELYEVPNLGIATGNYSVEFGTAVEHVASRVAANDLFRLQSMSIAVTSGIGTGEFAEFVPFMADLQTTVITTPDVEGAAVYLSEPIRVSVDAAQLNFPSAGIRFTSNVFVPSGWVFGWLLLASDAASTILGLRFSYARAYYRP